MIKRFMSTHDLLAKDVLANREMAIAFLKAHMPKALANLVDWRTVKLDSANVEHVRQGNKKNVKSKEQSDLAFTFKFKNGELGAVLAHIEYQTSDDITFIIRVRHYQTSYLLDFIKKNKGITKLPLIFSILLYADEKPFKRSLDIYDYFENPRLAKDYAFTNQFVDLSLLSDDEIAKHGDIAGFELILKHVQHGDIDGKLDIVSKHLVTYDEIISQTLIRYMTKFSGLEYDQFCDKILTIEPTLEETMRTVAQQLKQQGRQEGIQTGIQQGIAQGLEQGRIQEKQETARSMINEGLKSDLIARCTGLELETVLELKKDVDNQKKR